MVYSTSTISDESDFRFHDVCRGDGRSRCHQNSHDHHSQTATEYKRDYSESGLVGQVSLNKMYQSAVDYRLYRLIHKLQRCYDKAISEMEKMRTKVAVEVKNQALNGQGSVSFLSFLTTFKRDCDYLQTTRGRLRMPL